MPDAPGCFAVENGCSSKELKNPLRVTGVTMTESTAHVAPDHGHDVTIVVNGRTKPWSDKDITFAQVVALAFNPVPSGPNVEVTVAYRRGEGNKPTGTLIPGESVRVKDGMV